MAKIQAFLCKINKKVQREDKRIKSISNHMPENGKMRDRAYR